MLVRVLPYLHLCLSIPNTKKLHVFDFLLILYVLPDLSSLGFIEPLAVAQILLQFGPWNMANKLVEIVPSGLVLINLQKLPLKSVSVQGHVKDICSICWDSSGQWIASASEDDVHSKRCLTSVLDLTPRRNYRCSMILGH
ncbi:hypothetical protein P8452_22086 [Trifolium repens]|nr:hypothetical protein P8452_22086 [Trifolium repens]